MEGNCHVARNKGSSLMSVEVPVGVHSPQLCLLDRERLKSIGDTVDSIEKKLDGFLDFDGPFVKIKGRLDMVESTAAKASKRVDEIARDIVMQERAMNGLAVKVASLSSILTGSFVFAALKLMG